MRIARRSPLRTYKPDDGADIRRDTLVEALESLAVAIRLGYDHLAVNPYAAQGRRALWRVDWMIEQIRSYSEADIESLKRAAERRRMIHANLCTLSFGLGIVGGFVLYLLSLALGAGAIMAASFAVLPVTAGVTACFYRQMLAASAVRADLTRWAHALDDARKVVPHAVPKAA